MLARDMKEYYLLRSIIFIGIYIYSHDALLSLSMYAVNIDSTYSMWFVCMLVTETAQHKPLVYFFASPALKHMYKHLSLFY